MSSFDLKNNIKQLVALNVQAISTDTTTVGNIIDTKGYESLSFVLFAGVLAAGDVQVLIEAGDAANLSDAAAVSDTFLIGTELATNISTANGISSIGYVDTKRYVRLSAVSANSADLTAGAIAILGTPLTSPVV